MFPAYFTLISACAAISVAAFAYLHPWKTASAVERYQLGFLISALGFNLSNLLVFTPMTIEVSTLPPTGGARRLWGVKHKTRFIPLQKTRIGRLSDKFTLILGTLFAKYMCDEPHICVNCLISELTRTKY
jgi:hypothetical protein